MDKTNTVIVFSHLRWEFVWQRPQHILSRIAKNKKLIFIEEPTAEEKVYSPAENITVVQPQTGPTNGKELAKIAKHYAGDTKIGETVFWFYSPMFVDVLDELQPGLVVFDVMDELSAFKGAPPELLAKEKKLFGFADIVFTGGKSLYESKRKHHNNVFCFPSSVEREHFETALSDLPAPTDLVDVKKPIVGYYGVIDERIDLDLLGKAADMLPDVSLVMIGPVVKIHQEALPKNPNIFYPGGKQYKELPAYLKQFDIAMMPFALNESTKFISPTKTLEYMAAKKPIISSPINDVVSTFDKEVKIFKTPEQFVQLVNYFLNEPAFDKQTREKAQSEFIEATSWDKTVQKMVEIIDEEYLKKDSQKLVETIDGGHAFAVL